VGQQACQPEGQYAVGMANKDLRLF
jgi:hypothetical protein